MWVREPQLLESSADAFLGVALESKLKPRIEAISGILKRNMCLKRCLNPWVRLPQPLFSFYLKYWGRNPTASEHLGQLWLTMTGALLVKDNNRTEHQDVGCTVWSQGSPAAPTVPSRGAARRAQDPG